MPTVTIPARSAVDAVFAVLFAPAGDKPPDADSLRPAIVSWRDRHLRDPLRAGVAMAQDNGWVSLQVARAVNLSIPRMELLRQVGAGEFEERILEVATHAVVCGCPGINIRPRIGLWSALATALAVADRLQGIVFDPESRSILHMDRGIESFSGKGTISVAQHIMIPFSAGQDGGLGWLATRGMGKFGLPDIELRGVPPNLDRLNFFMNSVAQLLLEAAFRRSEGIDYEAGEIEADSVELPDEYEVQLPDELEIDDVAVARAHGRVPHAGSPESAVARVGLRFDPAKRNHHPPMIRLVAPEGEPDQEVWLNRIDQTLGTGART